MRTAASDAGRDPMDITPALIRFIVTGRSLADEIDEVVESDIAKIFTLNCDGEGLGAARRRTPAWFRFRRIAGSDTAI